MKRFSNWILGLALLCGVSVAAAAQPAAIARAPLRADLRVAGERLSQHPHPYAMSEEVARVRLQKMGFEQAQAFKSVGTNAFQAEVMKEGKPQRIEIDRISGAVKQAVPQ